MVLLVESDYSSAITQAIASPLQDTIITGLHKQEYGQNAVQQKISKRLKFGKPGWKISGLPPLRHWITFTIFLIQKLFITL